MSYIINGIKKYRKKGISHRSLNIALVAMIIFVSGVIVFATMQLTDAFWGVTRASVQHSDLQKAAHELMSASDYLTEQVQRFTINGDPRFMDEYFNEAFSSRRREEAISKMAVDSKAIKAKAKLQEALNVSMDLMNIEYYAMRLVIEAKGYSKYHEALDGVTLSVEDIALSSQEKMQRAAELVHSDDYYLCKEEIRSYVQAGLTEIDLLAEEISEEKINSLNREIWIVRLSIVFQVMLVAFTMWLTTHLVITPILNAVDKIKTNDSISETGSNEFRYLANAYNKMYEKNKSRIENLSYKASHDELTGAYNRTGYDVLLSDIDLDNTYMMLFDVDNFKMYNDTYGHEIGDKVLIKLVNTLRRVFRDDDYICRIGGDEFVVFMKHSDNIQHSLVKSKIDLINAELRNTNDGLPEISISVGVIDGNSSNAAEDMFEKVDTAMYESKHKGKGTLTFAE